MGGSRLAHNNTNPFSKTRGNFTSLIKRLPVTVPLKAGEESTLGSSSFTGDRSITLLLICTPEIASTRFDLAAEFASTLGTYNVKNDSLRFTPGAEQKRRKIVTIGQIKYERFLQIFIRKTQHVIDVPPSPSSARTAESLPIPKRTRSNFCAQTEARCFVAIGFGTFVPYPFVEKEWIHRVGGILVISGMENISASVFPSDPLESLYRGQDGGFYTVYSDFHLHINSPSCGP